MSEEPRDDPLVGEQTDAAAEEAAAIGGSPDGDLTGPGEEGDPAERPLREAGQGEAEGFEQAEAELVDNAEHGDQHRFPGRHAGDPEEPSGQEHGEADDVQGQE